jgi:hypothetical protein
MDNKSHAAARKRKAIRKEKDESQFTTRKPAPIFFFL